VPIGYTKRGSQPVPQVHSNCNGYDRFHIYAALLHETVIGLCLTRRSLSLQRTNTPCLVINLATDQCAYFRSETHNNTEGLTATARQA